ncbi:MAG: glycosyltransferase, partial [Candidatus Omnitrophota bacterium]
LIEQWGLKPYFSVEGEIEFGKVPQFINGLDVAILFFKPVRKNPGNPLKLFEYLACGKPVIATDIENYGRLLEHHSAGLAVDSENPVSVAEAILRLARDQELYRRMSAQARQVAVGRFSWKNTALTIESPLKGIIK